MKRSLTTLMALVLMAAPASAALRSPQIAVSGSSLSSLLTGFGESINVGTQQDATQVWGHTVSGSTGYTIMFQGTTTTAKHTIGMYNSNALPLSGSSMFPLLDGSLGPQAFATATFRPGNQLVVNRFDASANPLGATTYTGVNNNSFGFYVDFDNTTAAGLVCTQDYRNGGAGALTFAGTGANLGTWWLCFDESAPAGDNDFDDEVIMLESVNPTPVSSTSWGDLKARFR